MAKAPFSCLGAPAHFRVCTKIHIRITAKVWASHLKKQHEFMCSLEDATQMSEEMEEKCVETKLKEQAK